MSTPSGRKKCGGQVSVSVASLDSRASSLGPTYPMTVVAGSEESSTESKLRFDIQGCPFCSAVLAPETYVPKLSRGPEFMQPILWTMINILSDQCEN